MHTASRCPDTGVLQQFLHGEMHDAQAEALEQHLLECGPCAEALHRLTAQDSLVNPMQAALVRGQESMGEQVDHLIERLVDSPPLAAPTTTAEANAVVPAETAGTIIGPYHLLEKIGEGGFGVVFTAEQRHPVRRKVALKVLKPGMDTRQVIARFEAERQALALMDHPNIAHVFDGGETASGRPYFVMELVPGIPITEFCDQNHLSIRQRLELFLEVCQAVQHAHQKGIIHRDIKPSNLLVTLHDGTPVVKVIDFGIAKALGHQLSERTVFTSCVQMIGTPLYMSPEQAGLSGLDTDTRSDIYALGVLLYELLTGTTPFSEERFKEAGYDEIRRIIREEEPPRPSARLGTLGQAGAVFSTQRQSNPKRLNQSLRAELDWIVMKALEKDRTRRYETASAFAADVRRYLHDEPVQACPPALGYRLRKTVRRHKGPVVAASLVLLALVGGIIGTTSAMIRATDAEAAAVTAAQQKERALKEAQKQKQLALKRFYAAQMNLAHQAWEAGKPASVLDLLEGLRPRAGEDDLRTFEWYYLWRLCHRGHRLALQAPTHRVWGVAISPDGKTVAAGGANADVQLWDAATGQPRATWKGPGGTIKCLAFSPDRKTLAAGMHTSLSQTLVLYDTRTGKRRASLGRLQGNVWSVAFARDGRMLASGGHDGTVKLWDPATGRERATLSGHSTPVNCVAFSPDGKTLATGSAWGQPDPMVKLWDLTAAPPRVRLELPGAFAVAFSPDGTQLALGSGDSPPRVGLRLFEASTGRLRATLPGHVGTVFAVAFAPDGKTLASAGDDRTLRLWHPRTGRQHACYAVGSPVYALDFAPDGTMLASAGDHGTINLWDTAPAPDDLVLPNAGAWVAFSPYGKTLVSSGREPAKLWDVASWKPRTVPFPAGAKPTNVLAFSHDGKTLAVARGRSLRLLDVIARRERAAIEGRTVFWSVAFSRDDRTLASASWGAPAASLWDLSTRRVRATVTPHPAAGARAVAFSPADGSLLATGSQYALVKLWDAATLKEKATLQAAQPGTMNWIWAVAFSADGTLLAGADRNGLVKIWDVDTGVLRATLKGHTDSVFAVAFSPDGRTLATGGDDRMVKLWDVATGQERMTLKGHQAAIPSVAFSPDGTLLATASWDDTVRVWRTATDAAARARRRAGSGE